MRILIANRGEIARRVIRTAKRLGHETVAVFADPDEFAPFVSEADHAVRLGPAALAESYLSAERLLAAAAETRADAVHPGYGFLSENAEFAQAVLDAGLTWIGPKPDAIATSHIVCAVTSTLPIKRLILRTGAETERILVFCPMNERGWTGCLTIWDWLMCSGIWTIGLSDTLGGQIEVRPGPRMWVGASIIRLQPPQLPRVPSRPRSLPMTGFRTMRR